ncbi:MAG: vitamin B12-dependent ribonucleotide reductase, partial [Proteobacteria bacterium]
ALLRRFTKPGFHPYQQVEWQLRDCEIKGASGESIFHQKGVEVPAAWSQMAATIVASKYLHGEIGTADREYSIKQLLDRVANTLSCWAEKDRYFSSKEALENFRAELTYILLHQYAAFNSPVWFNLGVEQHPQCSACFILSVEDSMPSLLELQGIEGVLFKSGSGCGTNLSTIRSSKERLAGGGTASGPLSFMRGYDSWAGSIKSGGKTRRAAKMQILNVDHPDIIDFIRCKADEEKISKCKFKYPRER